MDLIRFDIDGCDYLKPEERIGKVVGIYKVIGIDRESKGGNRIYKCRCTFCGLETIHSFAEMNRVSKCTHENKIGEYKDFTLYWKDKRIQEIFKGMVRRCYTETNRDYRWYGAKGIKIYDEWMRNPTLFEEWAINNGYSDNLTIDRINPSKDYCPDNCRWISLVDNAKYKSTTRLIEVNGERHTGREWSAIIGYNINLINRYIRLYGLDDTKEFISRIMNNPELASKKDHNESLFDLYMS